MVSGVRRRRERRVALQLFLQRTTTLSFSASGGAGRTEITGWFGVGADVYVHRNVALFGSLGVSGERSIRPFASTGCRLRWEPVLLHAYDHAALLAIVLRPAVSR